MDIKSAANQIEGAVRAYLATDEHGLPLVPERMQRPIILMGPPGVGKTAIVSQVAERLDIDFVSYSITHHTRQSALGLPYIAEATFGDKNARVSRYTMSEIIAAVYDAMERSGRREGILFLDEVNCASETLAPAMLQFLQYKTFGQHKLPAGWVIVCAGNPPEYNRAAREFDPAMLDRMKRIDVEPSLDAWMDYAQAHGMHPAVLTYLSNKPANFYKVRAAVNGSRLVTARGWEDLSRMLVAYRHEGLEVDLDLVSQYLQDKEIAEDFSLYLELFSRYEDDYKILAILDGSVEPKIAARAQAAPLDERFALVNMLLSALLREIHESGARTRALRMLDDEVAALKTEGAASPQAIAGLAKGADGSLSDAGQLTRSLHDGMVERLRASVAREEALGTTGGSGAAQEIAALRLEELESVKCLAARMDNAFEFLDTAFGDGQEVLTFTTHLAADGDAVHFIADAGVSSFLQHAGALMLHERGVNLLSQADALA